MLWYNPCITCGNTTLFHFDYCLNCIDPITEDIEYDAFQHGEEDALVFIQHNKYLPFCDQVPQERLELIRLKDREWYSWHYIRAQQTIRNNFIHTQECYKNVIKEFKLFCFRQKTIQKCSTYFGKKYPQLYEPCILNLMSTFIFRQNPCLKISLS